MYLQVEPVLPLDAIGAFFRVDRTTVAYRAKRLGLPQRRPAQHGRRGQVVLGRPYRGAVITGELQTVPRGNRIVTLVCPAGHTFNRFLCAINQGKAGGCPTCKRADRLDRLKAAAEARGKKHIEKPGLPSPRKRLFAATAKLGPEQRDAYRLYRRKGFASGEALRAVCA